MLKRIALITLVAAALFIGWWNHSLSIVPLKKHVQNTAGTFGLARPAPVARTESGGTVWKDRLYLVGGIGAWAQTLTSFLVYDRASDAWSVLPDLPQKINHAGVVAFDDKIYAVGGFGPLGIRLRGFMFARWRPLDTVHIYDLKLGRWTQGAPMPSPRGAGGVAVADGAIWYAGGINEALEISADLFRYDPVKDRWEKMPSMPTPRDHLRLEASGARLFAISGRKDDLRHNLSAVEGYDIASGAWQGLADIPEGRGGMATAVHGGYIYGFGGEQVWHCLDRIDRYDIARDRWETVGRMPEGRHGIIAGVMSDGIHLVSGGRHPRVSISGIHRVFEPSQRP